MQTFLPYTRYDSSARCLDTKRLNKQIVECYQIMKNISGNPDRWQHHPAVRMWMGYKNALALYAYCCHCEYERRFKRTHRSYLNIVEIIGKDIMDDMINAFNQQDRNETFIVRLPPWYSDERLHISHRANLLRKNLKGYSQFDWIEQPSSRYWWPL